MNVQRILKIAKSLALGLLLLNAVACHTEVKQEAIGKEDSNTVLGEDEVQITEPQMKQMGIVLGQPTTTNRQTTLTLTGKIDVPPQNIVSVSVPLGGYLKKSELLPGTRVERGQVLAIMEDQTYIKLQRDYLQAKAKVQFLQAEYDRVASLNLGKAVSDKAREQAELDLSSQRVDMKALRQDLELIGINPDKLTLATMTKSIAVRSPIHGFVSKVNVNIGKYVTGSEVLFELIDPEDIHLNLKVYERDINNLQVGQKVLAYTNTNPGVMHKCEIILVSKNLADDRSAEVHCHFEKYDKALAPGMFMNAQIALKNRQAVVVPNAAVLRYQGQRYIFIASGKNKFKLMPIAVGEEKDRTTEIDLDGPINKQQVVVGGAYNLLMALKNIADE